jgi:hypothetical protein
MDLKDIYRTYYPTVATYIYFSSAHETFYKTVNMPDHKNNLIFNLNQIEYFFGSEYSKAKNQSMEKLLKV